MGPTNPTNSARTFTSTAASPARSDVASVANEAVIPAMLRERRRAPKAPTDVPKAANVGNSSRRRLLRRAVATSALRLAATTAVAYALDANAASAVVLVTAAVELASVVCAALTRATAAAVASCAAVYRSLARWRSNCARSNARVFFDPLAWAIFRSPTRSNAFCNLTLAAASAARDAVSNCCCAVSRTAAKASSFSAAARACDAATP